MNLKDESIYYLKRIFRGGKLQSKKANYKVFDKYKCIFVHIPKNGGTSIGTSLLDTKIAHMSALDYKTLFGKKVFNSYFKFAFIRNPFTRLVSAYDFMKAGAYGPNNKENAKNVAIVKRFNTMEEFVMKYLTPDTAKRIRQFRPQYYYLCDSNLNLIIDFVGKFENIQEDYDYVRSKIGTGEPLQKLNVTKSKRYPLEYYYTNNEMIRKIISIYEKDFEIFNYSKELPILQQSAE